MADILTPEERKGLFGEDVPAAAAPAPTPSPAPQASPQGLTDEQRRALFEDGQPQSAISQQPAVTPSDALEAFQAGTLSGIGDVAGGIQRIFGYDPSLSTRTQSQLTAEQKAGMEAHPWAAGGGRMLGQTAATLPATLATSYAMPTLGAASLPALMARGAALVGPATGAVNALMTSGENPQDPLGDRALRGALWGIPFGALGGAAESAAGAGQTIPRNVQTAGQRMQAAGVDIEPGNLPRTGAAVNARGGPPTTSQAQQINQGYGGIFGETTPDFTPPNTDALITKLGQGVGNAVNAGKIDYDVPLANGSHPGQTFEQRLAEIEADNPGVPAVKRIINNIIQKVGSNGEIAGNDVGDLLKTYNPLDSATRSRVPQISEPANDIEAALHDAFGQSSSPGQAAAYSQAREKYKLALAGENAADPVTGNIDPSRLMTVIGQMYKGAKRLGTGQSMTDRAINYARDAAQIFGGQQSAAPILKPGGWLVPAALSAGGTAAELGSSFLPFALPAAVSNPLVAGAAITAPLALRLGTNLLRHYQGTPGFASNLLTRGTQTGSPYLAGVGGTVGASLGNQQW